VGLFLFVLGKSGTRDEFDEFLETLEALWKPYDVENTKLAIESTMHERAKTEIGARKQPRMLSLFPASHPELP